MAAYWADRRVFMTGATGFIGTEIATALRDRSVDVTVLTRRASRADRLAELGCEVVEGDVTDAGSFELGEADTVIHAAAWVAFGIPKSKEALFRATNVTGTEVVLEKARDAGVETFCHMSSVAAIGPTPAGLYTEERALEGRYPDYHSLYEETKHQAHVHVLENHGKMHTVLPMPSVVIGTGSDTEDLLRAYLGGLSFGLKGDTPTGFVHVRDVVDGVLLSMERGDGAYVLNDENLTVTELLYRFEQASGVPAPTRRIPMGVAKFGVGMLEIPYRLRGKVPPVSKELIESLAVPYTYSSKRAQGELGWRPDLEGHLTEDFQALAGQADGA